MYFLPKLPLPQNTTNVKISSNTGIPHPNTENLKTFNPKHIHYLSQRHINSGTHFKDMTGFIVSQSNLISLFLHLELSKNIFQYSTAFSKISVVAIRKKTSVNHFDSFCVFSYADPSYRKKNKTN